MKGNRYFLNFSPQSGLAEHTLFIFVLDKLFLKSSYTLSLQDHITIFVLWCYLPTGFDCYFKLILLIFKCRETNEAPPSVSQCTKCVCYLGPHLFTNYSAYCQSTEMMRLMWAPLTPFSPLLMLVARMKWTPSLPQSTNILNFQSKRTRKVTVFSMQCYHRCFWFLHFNIEDFHSLCIRSLPQVGPPIVILYGFLGVLGEDV